MATTTALRPPTIEPGEIPPAPAGTDMLAAFRAGRGAEDRLADLLAFALATERGDAPTAEAIDSARRAAQTALSDHAFRYLHNSVEQIRREAAAEQQARQPRPPGLGTIFLANMLALVIFAAVAGWLALHPATLAGLAGIFAG